MNEKNLRLVRAQLQNVFEVLEADRFYKFRENDAAAIRSRISDLRWSVVKLADAITELLPDEPFTSDK